MARPKRLQVQLKPETRAALEEYAEALGIPTATAASQLLDQSAPTLAEMSKALRKATKAPARAMKEMAGIINKATEEADQIALDLKARPTRRRKAG